MNNIDRLTTKIFFITAIGTDIGKTFVVEKLCRNLLLKEEKVNAIKPLISGFVDDDLTSDSAKILKALNKEVNLKNIDEISPWRFRDPVSPNIAAKREKKPIDFDKVVEFCQKNILKAKKNNGYLFIEGAGGVMSPVNDDKTFLDLIVALNIPIILVVSDYLGAISHSLTAISALEMKNVKIERIIFNSRQEDFKHSQEIFTSLKTFLKNQKLEFWQDL